MAVDLFTCCTCPEPPGYDAEVDDPLPKYRNRCGCPTATVICESFEKNAELCGWSEGEEFESSPPKKYLTLTETHSGQYIVEDECCDFGDCVDYNPREETWSGSFTCDYVPGSTCGTYTQTGKASKRLILRGCDRECEGCPREVFLISDETTEEGFCSTSLGGGSNWQVTGATTAFNDNFFGTLRQDRVLSAEDTEADALSRATETEGTVCTSIYELRTTAFSFTVRTVSFNLELTNLCYNRAYEGCVRIRKRKAFSGTAPEGEVIEWEDVEPFTFGPITPTSANTEDGVTTTAEITDQDLVGGTEDARGWEYKIVSAHVWPVSVGCDCPTELGYTDPE